MRGSAGRERHVLQRKRREAGTAPAAVAHEVLGWHRQHTDELAHNVRSNYVCTPAASRRICPVDFFSNTTLDAATYVASASSRSDRKRRSKALSERDRVLQLLEEEVERVKNEIKKKAIERERRQKRIKSPGGKRFSAVQGRLDDPKQLQAAWLCGS